MNKTRFFGEGGEPGRADGKGSPRFLVESPLPPGRTKAWS